MIEAIELRNILMFQLDSLDLLPGDTDKAQAGEVIEGLTKLLAAYVAAWSGPVPQAHEEFVQMCSRHLRREFKELNAIMEAQASPEELRRMRRHFMLQTIKEAYSASDE